MSDSNHFSSAWDLGGVEKRSSNSLRRLNFGHRLSSSELCLDSLGGERLSNFKSILRDTDSIDSDASISSTFPERITSFDLSSLDSYMDLNSDDFTSHKSEEHTASPFVPNPKDLDSSKENSADRGERRKDQGQLFQAIKRFNLDADKGLKLLVEREFIEMTPESVAHFLFNQERLSKKQIGVVIGGHKDFNKSVLHNFVRLHKFQKVILVQALRQFLWNFR